MTLFYSSTYQYKVKQLNIKEFTNDFATLYHINHPVYDQYMPLENKKN